MLSYRHAFHAGNHADVLKHVVAIQLLRYFGLKDTPYMYIDTHAGAGLYALDSGYAAKNAEYKSGIGRLWDLGALPVAVADYVAIVKALNPSGKMRYYPGSPYIAATISRGQDRLRLFELHPSDNKLLQENAHKWENHAASQGERPSARGKRLMILPEDGFLALKALLPPPSRRGLVLIDPSYEDKSDYHRVKTTLAEALTRFAGGTFAVWYPLLQRQEACQLPDKLKHLTSKNWLNVSLSVDMPSTDRFGMHGSGMFIVNPPWTLESVLREVMPFLASILGQEGLGKFILESGEG